MINNLVKKLLNYDSKIDNTHRTLEKKLNNMINDIDTIIAILETGYKSKF